jgi:hypothetical protein
MLLLLLALLPALTAVAAEPLPGVDEFATELERSEGFFTLLRDPRTAELYLQIPHARGEFIFQTSLPRGVGSNDLGLDRGRLADTRLVRFERVGRRALLRALNTDYRADSPSPAERRAVEEAFASSVLAGLEVVAEDDTGYVVAYTPFLLTDVTRIAALLDDAGEGSYRVDTARSAPWPDRTRSFPKNTELEAVLTLVGDPEGRELRAVTPSPEALTVHVHHSLVALPEPGYRPRAFHPRSGYSVHRWVDYAQPLTGDLVRRVIRRHRLEPLDPAAARLRPVEPIVYHLDPGTPEPVRSALLDGARWWAEAFEAAGWDGAFEVRLLPEEADPLDVRYNVIQWVHRSTRGWSYGMSVRDPRTGEILKGHVSLGSLRVRQDLLIARALAAEGTAAEIDAATLELALARLRQLAAHEVGHTLGLAHNYAASTQDRASVMDYPHPRLATPDAPLGPDAYDVGVGAWDLHTIRYGYSHFEAGEEAAGLAAIIADARALAFLSDPDARPADAAHPAAHLWDEGTDPVDELERLLAIRAAALARFDAGKLPQGAPRSDLEAMLVPLYYLHRYQTEAAARLLGGLVYDYATTGSGGTTPVPASEQRRALEVLLGTLSADVLALDEELVARITPQAYGYRRTREAPPGRTGLAFDAVTPAEAAAEHTLRFLLAPGRLARLDQQHALDPSLPDARELLEALVTERVMPRPDDGLRGLVERRVALLVVEHLATLAWNDVAAPEITSTARAIATRLEAELAGARGPRESAAHRARLASLLARAREDGVFERRDDVARMPPGAPI